MTFALDFSCAGTGATYTLIGADSCGSISITTGAGSGGGTGQLGTFTFGSTIWASSLRVSIIPINANAQGLSGDPVRLASDGTGNMKQTNFTLDSSTLIADSTTYTWAYSVN